MYFILAHHIDSTYLPTYIPTGLPLEETYPYEGTQGRCKNTPVVEGTQVIAYNDVPPNDDDAFTAAIAKQPVSVAIEADERQFQVGR